MASLFISKYEFRTQHLKPRKTGICIRYMLCCIISFFFYKSSKCQPTIIDFTPAQGAVGSIVTINGTNFSNVVSENIVYFGGVRAVVNSCSNSSLSVTVPAGAGNNAINITTNGLTATSTRYFNVTFPGTASFASSSFASELAFSGFFHINIDNADFDGDGKLDIIANNSSDVYIDRNTSAGSTISFGTRTGLSVSCVTGFAVGDVTGDGKLDVVVANSCDYVVSIFRNTSTPGTISFAAKVSYATGSLPSSAIVTELDGDGKPDIVVVNEWGNSFSAYLNLTTSGSVAFVSKVDFAAAFDPYQIAAADFDNDGKNDIVITSTLAKASVYKNTSTPGLISFNTGIDYATAPNSHPSTVVVSDLDNDGKMDFATSNNDIGTISVFRNISSVGTVSFSSRLDVSTGSGSEPADLAISDLNGDSNPDLVVRNRYNSGIAVIKNNSSSGSLSFDPKVDYAAGPTSKQFITTGDFDSDGRTDIAISYSSPAKFTVFQNLITQVLPVQLLFFKGSLIDNRAVIKWQLSSEANFSHYVVEHSVNSYEYKPVYKIQGIGKSDYSYEHSDLAEGFNYFRLKMVDVDGTFKYSSIVNVLVKANNRVELFPNPAINLITVQHPYTTDGYIRITNASGFNLKTISAKNKRSTIIYLKPFSPGVYYVNWIKGNFVSTRTLIVN